MLETMLLSRRSKMHLDRCKVMHHSRLALSNCMYAQRGRIPASAQVLCLVFSVFRHRGVQHECVRVHGAIPHVDFACDKSVLLGVTKLA